MNFNFYFTEDIAIVPILTNGGAALLPALAATLGTFFTLLFKPKQLFKFCKEKPAAPIGLALFGVLIYFLVTWLMSPANASDGSRGRAGKTLISGNTAGTVSIDWNQIALARIKAKRRGQFNKTIEAPSLSTTVTDSPFIFRGDSSRVGVIGTAPQGSLDLVWDYYPSWIDDDGSVETENSAMILSSPAVHGNYVFAASCLLDPPHSYGIFFCVDAMTGETVWSVDQVDGEEMKGFFSSPAVTADGKYVIVGQGLHPDTNCKLVCIEVATGKVHWTVSSELHIESSPAIADGIVYVGAGAIENPVTRKPKSHTGYVMAVRISDGKTLWKQDVIDPESSPIVHEGTLFIGSGFNGEAVVALRTGSDEELKQQNLNRIKWQTKTPYPITGAVTYMDGKVFVGGGNGDFVFRDPNPAGVVISLDTETGKIIWQKEMPDAVLGAVAAGKLLICPVAAGKVIALNPADGTEIWNTAISGKAPVLAGAAMTEDFVYAVSHDGYLGKIALTSGELLEKTYINSESQPGEQGLSISSPMIANGMLYIGSETGGLRCYTGMKK